MLPFFVSILPISLIVAPLSNISSISKIDLPIILIFMPKASFIFSVFNALFCNIFCSFVVLVLTNGAIGSFKVEAILFAKFSTNFPALVGAINKTKSNFCSLKVLPKALRV